MQFESPWLLLLIPALGLLLLFFKKNDRSSSLAFSSAELLSGLGFSLRVKLAKKLFLLRLAVVVLFLLALARPRLPLEPVRIQTEGVDIVLAIDASTSMLAEDFLVGKSRKNRLEVVKEVVVDFIEKRKSDRIAMVAFAARAYTVCPLTLDYAWLIKNLERVEAGTIEDGTAIGSAISSSLNRLKDSQAKSKIIILLTDGMNNAGAISPLTAAEAAKGLGIKVYTIGAGTKGLAPYPVKDLFGQTLYQNIKVEIDEQTLQKIAQLSAARYFRATDTESLRWIYQEIDKLEKSRIEQAGFRQYRELFSRFLTPAIALLILEVILSNTILRKLP